MKHLTISLLFIASMIATSCSGQDNGEKETEVLIETSMGDIRVKLYNDTPGHRDNFIQNIKDKKYDGTYFHRVVRNFMIQGGNPDHRPGEVVDTTKEVERIPAEMKFPTHFSRKGVLAAARDEDDINPEKMSDKYQFYIVTGKSVSDADLDNYEKAREEKVAEELYNKKIAEPANAAKIQAYREAREQYKLGYFLQDLMTEARREVSDNPPLTYPKNVRRAYRIHGGAPWLDDDYTIFGEVVEGMKVVDNIQKVRTSAKEVPLQEIRIIKVSLIDN